MSVQRLANRILMTTPTTGTGTITLASAVSGYQTFAAAGVQNGETVRYLITEGANWEIGAGTYSSAGPTLTRNVEESSAGGAPINLGGSARVAVVSVASDFMSIPYRRTEVVSTGRALGQTDNGALLRCSGTITLDLPALSSVRDGYKVTIAVVSGTTTVSPNGSDTINGVGGSFTVTNGSTVTFVASRVTTQMWRAVGSVLQSSATDTTAGRLLTVGAFGLGATSSPGESITTAAQLDGLRGLRLDRVTSSNVSAVGGPSGSSGAAVLTLGHSNANASQLWMEVVSPYRIWRRGFSSSTWGPWQRVAVLGIEAPEQVSTAAGLDAIVGLNTVRIAAVDVPSVGGPSGAAGGAIVLSVGFDSTTARQLWFETSSPYRIWQRARISSGWQPWRLLTNLSTSNANGVSYRYAEGEQRCIRADLSVASVAAVDGVVFESADVTWTFPQAFLTGSIPVLHVNGANSDVIGYRIMSISETAVTFRLRARASIGSSVTIRAEATGQWA